LKKKKKNKTRNILQNKRLAEPSLDYLNSISHKEAVKKSLNNEKIKNNIF
jgi:hypothetical protein